MGRWVGGMSFAYWGKKKRRFVCVRLTRGQTLIFFEGFVGLRLWGWTSCFLLQAEMVVGVSADLDSKVSSAAVSPPWLIRFPRERKQKVNKIPFLCLEKGCVRYGRVSLHVCCFWRRKIYEQRCLELLAVFSLRLYWSLINDSVGSPHESVKKKKKTEKNIVFTMGRQPFEAKSQCIEHHMRVSMDTFEFTTLTFPFDSFWGG